MLQCLANVEAVLDFGEDEEIAEEVAQQVLPRMQALQKQLQHHLINGALCHTVELCQTVDRSLCLVCMFGYHHSPGSM